MAKKKDKRVTLKIKKKPIMERIGRLFTGPTNIDAKREKLVKNPEHNRPNRLWVDIHNDSTEEILRKITEDIWYKGHNRLDTDPDKGDVRRIQVTKPHYSEIEKYPYTDDPTFKNEMATQYIIEQQKTRQFIENVLKQNKEKINLPQSESDLEIRRKIEEIAKKTRGTKPLKASSRTPKKSVISRWVMKHLLEVDNLLTRLATPTGVEAQFIKYKMNLHPEIRKKLQLRFPVVTPDTVIPTSKITNELPSVVRKETVTSPESLQKRLLYGYGDKLKVEASRTDPNFKKLSPDAQKKYLEFMHKQIKSNQPMTTKQIQILKDTAPGGKYNVDKVGGWLGKNLSLTEKLQKGYIQTRRLNIIKEEQRKIVRREKAAGRLGDKMKIIIQGIKKPTKGK